MENIKMTDEEKLKAGRGEFNYKGNLCRQIIGGWQIHGVNCSTFEEVEETLLNIGSILSESIVNPVTVQNRMDGSISCTNTEKMLDKTEKVLYNQNDK